MNSTDIQYPVEKAASAISFSFLAITSWSDVAAILAALYTLTLMAEWWWKKFWKPFAIKRGWIKAQAAEKVGAEDA
jgi:hypothetical protein